MGLSNEIAITTTDRTLTKDDDDVFDEVMDCGEDLRAAFEGHADDNNCGEHDPGNEANDRGITDKQTRIGRGELNQTTYSDFDSGRVVAEKRRDSRRNLLPLPARNHPRDTNERRRQIQSNERALLRGVFISRRL